VDTANRAREDLQRAEIDELRVRFVEPAGLELVVSDLSNGSLTVALNSAAEAADDPPGEAAVGQIVELSVTLTALGVVPGSVLKFFVELFSHGQSADRAPRETTLELTVPPPDFEQIMWQV
jgi:hypothetical protein